MIVLIPHELSSQHLDLRTPESRLLPKAHILSPADHRGGRSSPDSPHMRAAALIFSSRAAFVLAARIAATAIARAPRANGTKGGAPRVTAGAESQDRAWQRSNANSTEKGKSCNGRMLRGTYKRTFTLPSSPAHVVVV